MKVLALTHGPSVGPGVFGTEVVAAGHELEECHVAAGGTPSTDADAILVFGGAMHPDQGARHPWLLDEHRSLVGVLDCRTPVLGVCLGAQLLAQAAGAPVHPAAEPEVGWLPVELTEAATDVEDAEALRAATRERIAGWNAFGRGSRRRFLESV